MAYRESELYVCTSIATNSCDIIDLDILEESYQCQILTVVYSIATLQSLPDSLYVNLNMFFYYRNDAYNYIFYLMT